MLNTSNQNTSTSTSKIERVAVVTPQITVWTGETVLREKDLHLGEGGYIPEKSFASLGRKALINPERLLVFRKIRENFKRTCSEIGVPFLSGYAIDVQKYQDIKPKLDALIKQFEAEVDDLCAQYTTLVEAWKQENPAYSVALERDGKSVDEVRSRFSAGYLVNKIQSVDGEEEALTKQVEGLYSTLLTEIRNDASGYLTRSLKKAAKNEISQRARSVVARIVKKLESLSFLNPKAQVLADAVKAADAKLPRSGFMRESDFWRIFAIMSVLADEAMTAGIIDGSLSFDSVGAQFDPRLAQPIATPSTEPEVKEEPQTGDLFEAEEEVETKPQTEPEPEEAVVAPEEEVEVEEKTESTEEPAEESEPLSAVWF